MSNPQRYYERFQVEDVLTFISRQLVQAKTVDGREVYIQEIKTNQPLPPGAREIFLNMNFPHVAPVLDVIIQDDRITLVHPPFSGDPLPLVVNEKDPMKPRKALRVFEKLLKTMQSLEQLPLSLSTTLDPRNICIADEPYVLFYWIKNYSLDPPDEQWQHLLIYLLTGVIPKNKGERLKLLSRNHKIPTDYRQLALDCYDPNKTRDDILLQVRQLMEQPSVESRSLRKKTLSLKPIFRLGAIILISFAIGGWLGYTAATLNGSREAAEKPGHPSSAVLHREGKKVEFNETRNQYHLPQTQTGPVQVRGEIIRTRYQPFSIIFQVDDRSKFYGVNIDERGNIRMYESTDGMEGDDPTFVKLSEYTVSPNQRYKFDIRYSPGEPLRFSIQKKGDPSPRVAFGPEPIAHPVDAPYQVQFRGGAGTKLYNLNLTPE
ncbi:hypothetical protein C8P63_1293 [Melghirimyces profundicolus]|uniref:Uncharacterized protein n=1 Tax=Melghirimyces profundicolus TaxID=1242148 RepID=A0A2T6BAF6_9BACL|nr:hypothetical protein [Melghirimyces profundicolus]PTX53057.1 hypothetical protein C8P63_1293 [Melghirimyces profundicolus]